MGGRGSSPTRQLGRKRQYQPTSSQSARHSRNRYGGRKGGTQPRPVALRAYLPSGCLQEGAPSLPPRYPPRRLAPKSNSPVSKPAPASPKPIGLDGKPPPPESAKSTASSRASTIPTTRPKTAVIAPLNPPEARALLPATYPPTR